MAVWNIFRITADLSHLAAIGILILAIHRNQSAEGVSLISQGLYAVVFLTRYLDLFSTLSAWNVIFKIIFIASSIYTVCIMQWKYPRTRERELAWKITTVVVAGSAALAPFTMMIFEKTWGFRKLMWDFSEILESVCILPQLLLLRQTTVPTVIDSYYLLALGLYRGFYCINWLVRGLDPDDHTVRTVSVIFGVIQTLLYLDFAWVYYTRQRVKLRGGGVVDADDLRHSWLLRRIFGRRAEQDDLDEERGAFEGQGTSRGGRPNWGSRGISISADDTLDEHEEQDEGIEGAVDPDARMQDPDDLAKALDDDDDEDTPLQGSSNSAAPGVHSGEEWRD